MKTANDNCAMIYCEGFAKFLEYENCLLFDRMAGKNFKFAKDLSSHGSENPLSLETIRRRFVCDLWIAFGRDAVQGLAVETVEVMLNLFFIVNPRFLYGM